MSEELEGLPFARSAGRGGAALKYSGCVIFPAKTKILEITGFFVPNFIGASQNYQLRMLDYAALATVSYGVSSPFNLINLAPRNAVEKLASSIGGCYADALPGDLLLDFKVPTDQTLIIPLPEKVRLRGDDRGGAVALGLFNTTVNTDGTGGFIGRELSL